LYWGQKVISEPALKKENIPSEIADGFSEDLLRRKHTVTHSFAFLTSQGYFKSKILKHKTAMSVKWHRKSLQG
jgi:hypothetical protein